MKTFIISLSFCCFMISANSQNSNPDYFDWSVNNSSVIVEGKVIKSESYITFNDRYVYTLHDVVVFKSFKGTSSDTIKIATLGGEIGDVSQNWTHTTQFSEGDEGVFFAEFVTDDMVFENPILLAHGSNAFIEYQQNEHQYFAKSNYAIFPNIYQDIYLRLLNEYGLEYSVFELNSIEKSFFNNSLLVENDDEIYLEFKFDSLEIEGLSKIEFDVLARTSENGIELGEAFIFIDYSEEAFGSNVINAETAEISNGKLLEDAEVSTIPADFDENTIKITIPVNCVGSSLTGDEVVLSQSFGELLHVSLEIEDIYELASISMDDFLMKGNAFYFDNDLQDCVPFDSIIIPKELNPFLIPTVNNFFPNPITAGTGAILTIEGSEFGPDKGTIKFPNADTGGTAMMNADPADIEWSDTLITVRVPSTDEGVLDGKPAGSGVFEVATSGGVIAVASPGLSLDLEIRYAVRNRRSSSSGVAVRANLADNEAGDGVQDSVLTFKVRQEVADSNVMAKEIIETALCDWTTATGIQWQLGENFPAGGIPPSTNGIIFSTGGILGDETATTITTINVCQDFTQGGAPFFYTSNFDIFIQSDLSVLPMPTQSWYFGLDGEPALQQMDFYSVILHELGHAQNLKHANPKGKLMYYRLLPTETTREITIDEEDGGEDVLNDSNAVLGATSDDCPPAVMIGGMCLTNSSEVVYEKFGKIDLFPNPVKDIVTIEIERMTIREANIILFDAYGKAVLEKNIGDLLNEKNRVELDVSQLPQGVYFVSIHQNELYFINKITKI